MCIRDRRRVHGEKLKSMFDNQGLLVFGATSSKSFSGRPSMRATLAETSQHFESLRRKSRRSSSCALSTTLNGDFFSTTIGVTQQEFIPSIKGHKNPSFNNPLFQSHAVFYPTRLTKRDTSTNRSRTPQPVRSFENDKPSQNPAHHLAKETPQKTTPRLSTLYTEPEKEDEEEVLPLESTPPQQEPSSVCPAIPDDTGSIHPIASSHAPIHGMNSDQSIARRIRRLSDSSSFLFWKPEEERRRCLSQLAREHLHYNQAIIEQQRANKRIVHPEVENSRKKPKSFWNEEASERYKVMLKEQEREVKGQQLQQIEYLTRRKDIERKDREHAKRISELTTTHERQLATIQLNMKKERERLTREVLRHQMEIDALRKMQERQERLISEYVPTVKKHCYQGRPSVH
eukprot:TRINITY_DN21939_c0_g1_i1.p1 TRINITY_DN21939_c0_g1~~TRINITY_DN21939_c0_g1_i1.p1  ORF type:complete len:401 (-),score=54.17 TRINITY_DN21939_c0_g1_i1:101-1303(-)